MPVTGIDLEQSVVRELESGGRPLEFLPDARHVYEIVREAHRRAV